MLDSIEAAAVAWLQVKVNAVINRGVNESAVLELARHFRGSGHIEPLEPNYPGEVASRYRYLDGAGEIGLIASVTQPFYRGCTRARLSGEGKLYTCLLAELGHDLRQPLREAASQPELPQLLRDIWARRTDRYSELRTANTSRRSKVEMSYIGG